MNWKLSLFIVFAFAFAGILVIIQLITGIGFEIFVFPQLAPTLGYILIILIFKDMYKPIIIFVNKNVLIKVFIALLLPLLLFTVTCIIGLFLGIEMKTNKFFEIVNISIIGLLIGCITEEIGWRSFFQPSLSQKYSVFISSLIVGIVWGLWHVSYYQNGLLFMLVFIFFTISVSIIVVFLQKNTQNNLIISALFHSSINIGAKILSTEDSLNIINSIVWLIVSIIITIYDRENMFNKAK